MATTFDRDDDELRWPPQLFIGRPPVGLSCVIGFRMLADDGDRSRSGQASVRSPGPDQLWVTDSTEHPTREGKLYCAVVLDACSRRVAGWSIDAAPTAALVTNALGRRSSPAGQLLGR